MATIQKIVYWIIEKNNEVLHTLNFSNLDNSLA